MAWFRRVRLKFQGWNLPKGAQFEGGHRMSLSILVPLAVLFCLAIYLVFDPLLSLLNWILSCLGIISDAIPEDVRAAAERGNIDAQITLGIFYAHGSDHNRAQRWIQQSETTLSIRLREIAKRQNSMPRAA